MDLGFGLSWGLGIIGLRGFIGFMGFIGFGF